MRTRGVWRPGVSTLCPVPLEVVIIVFDGEADHVGTPDDIKRGPPDLTQSRYPHSSSRFITMVAGMDAKDDTILLTSYGEASKSARPCTRRNESWIGTKSVRIMTPNCIIRVIGVNRCFETALLLHTAIHGKQEWRKVDNGSPHSRRDEIEHLQGYVFIWIAKTILEVRWSMRHRTRCK